MLHIHNSEFEYYIFYFVIRISIIFYLLQILMGNQISA